MLHARIEQEHVGSGRQALDRSFHLDQHFLWRPRHPQVVFQQQKLVSPLMERNVDLAYTVQALQSSTRAPGAGEVSSEGAHSGRT